MGSSFYGNASIASGASSQAVDDMIIISDTQPTSAQNELWIDPDTQSVLVPTMADLERLVSSPLVASTAAAMTNTNKVYVYTGNETGMTNGNWYYYSGNAWVSGGVYNAVVVDTDDTLTVEGMPADAKVTGYEITDLKSVLDDLVIISTTLPTSEKNKIWIDSDADSVEVPTIDDMNRIKTGLEQDAEWHLGLFVNDSGQICQKYEVI